MEAIKAIIVDDELLAREMLQQMIESLNENIEIKALCTDLPEAIKAIHTYKPDLVFLDIDMPRFKGLEIESFIPVIDFDIVFTTAHQEFAINAIKLGASDYLLKPIDIDELGQCVSKITANKMLPMDNSIDNYNCDRLLVNTVQHIHLIDYKKILYFKANGAYTQIITSQGEITASKNLKYYEELLMHKSNFIRIHKSYIVNKSKIILINKSKQQAILENDDIIQIAQEKIDKLLQLE